MLSLEPHQQKLFLPLGGLLLVIVIGCVVLTFTHNTGWVIIAAAAAILLQFWALAGFLRALSHTDDSFDRLLAHSNQPEWQLAPAPVRQGRERRMPFLTLPTRITSQRGDQHRPPR